jgi:hypothetical protein
MLQTLFRSGRSSASTPITVHVSAKRHSSSTRRTKKALNIPPHPSFLRPPEAVGNTIIFNPPASEPSVYHTPFKFLPKSDSRRQANLPSLLSGGTRSASSSAAAAAGAEPAPLVRERDAQPKQYNVTEADVAEMRRLRAEDPVKNSVPTLAKRYGCTKLFVMMCCAVATPREHQKMRKAEQQAVRDRWGPRRAAAKEEKAKRLEMLFNGEL